MRNRDPSWRESFWKIAAMRRRWHGRGNPRLHRSSAADRFAGLRRLRRWCGGLASDLAIAGLSSAFGLLILTVGLVAWTGVLASWSAPAGRGAVTGAAAMIAVGSAIVAVRLAAIGERGVLTGDLVGLRRAEQHAVA